MDDSLKLKVKQDQLDKQVYDIMKELHNNGYLSPKSLTYVAETLTDMDINFDYDELKDLFDKHLDEIALGLDENKEEEKVHVNKNAGNPEFNMKMFNKGFANAEAASAAGEGAGCSECLYSGDVKEELLEGAGANYLKGWKLSPKELAQKLFSEKLVDQLLIKDDLSGSPVVKNMGLNGMDPIVAANENQSLPKPGFALYGNKGGGGKAPEGKVTHHIFGFSNGSWSELSVYLSLQKHTSLHDKIFDNLKSQLQSSQVITKIIDAHNKRVNKIKKSRKTVYDDTSGYFWRDYEYTLREAAIAIQESKEFNLPQIMFNMRSRELIGITQETSFGLLDAANKGYLKIKIDGKDYNCLPIINTQDAADKVNSTYNKQKLLITNGQYLIGVKPTNDVFLLLLVNIDGKLQTLRIDEVIDILENNKEPIEEDLSTSKIISYATIKKLLFRDIMNYTIQKPASLDIFRLASGVPGTDFIRPILKSIPDNVILDRFKNPQMFENELKKKIYSFIDLFIRRHKYSIYLDNIKQYPDIYDDNYNTAFEFSPRDITLKDEFGNLYKVDLGTDGNKPTTLASLLSAIENDKVIKLIDGWKIFFNSNGDVISGIQFDEKSGLLINPDTPLAEITEVDFNKVTPHEFKILQSKKNAIISLWVKLSNLKIVRWNPQLELSYGQFSYCRATDYYNILSRTAVNNMNAIPRNCFKGSNLKRLYLTNDIYNVIPSFIKRFGEQSFSYTHDYSLYLPKGIILEKDAFDGCSTVDLHYAGSRTDKNLSEYKWGKSKIRKFIPDSSYDINMKIKWVKLEEKLELGKLPESYYITEAFKKINDAYYVLYADENKKESTYIFATDTYQQLKGLIEKLIAKSGLKKGVKDTYLNELSWLDNYSGSATSYKTLTRMYENLESPFDINLLYKSNGKDSLNLYLVFPMSGYLVNVLDKYDIVEKLEYYIADNFDLAQFYYIDFPNELINSYQHSSTDAFIFKVNNQLNDANIKSTQDMLKPAAEVDYDKLYNSYTKQLGNTSVNFKRKEFLALLLDKKSTYIDFIENDILDNILDLDEQSVANKLATVTLDQPTIDALNNSGYSEDDYKNMLADIPDPGDKLYPLYNITMNAYYKAIFDNVLIKARKELEDRLLNAGITIDYKNKKFLISYKAYIDMFARNFGSNNYKLKDINKDSGAIDNYWDKDKFPGVFTENIFERIIKEIKKVEYSQNLWASSFLPYLRDNLKNIKK